ncbi:MerR family transcriptional regulator [Streptomyces sp. TRM43335]|uniref:MerR family transcriptional regulator n=1 Tax=Streptomyces taklimakanensis TaxID=2569853 RepID=A0A6G2B9F3_9ACTN|nr:MerR family transcriptional regulator [Streptomyces taklimakanensis]MTE18887.1 MerR family transcriptional regulator [Streptomyces taklimakanensis]
MTVVGTQTERERPGDESARSAAGVPPLDACASTEVVHPRPDGQDRYTISEVAAVTGLSAHTLRWYERIGLMPHIDRSHTGQRRFTNRDLDWLAFVAKLRLTGMPVADMVRYAELVREGDHTFEERQDLLRATREDVLRRIDELRSTLAVLDLKIDFYADARRASERIRPDAHGEHRNRNARPTRAPRPPAGHG